MLDLGEERQALLIINVFSGQMTDLVIKKLTENNIKLTRIPANMANLFQSQDRTVNDSAKTILKNKFTEWYISSICKQIEEGKSIEDIDIKLKILILKPLHTKWIIELDDYMTSEEGCKIISNGWKAAFITEVIEQGKKKSWIIGSAF